jgi:hypothetical protein
MQIFFNVPIRCLADGGLKPNLIATLEDEDELKN